MKNIHSALNERNRRWVSFINDPIYLTLLGATSGALSTVVLGIPNTPALVDGTAPELKITSATGVCAGYKGVIVGDLPSTALSRPIGVWYLGETGAKEALLALGTVAAGVTTCKIIDFTDHLFALATNFNPSCSNGLQIISETSTGSCPTCESDCLSCSGTTIANCYKCDEFYDPFYANGASGDLICSCPAGTPLIAYNAANTSYLCKSAVDATTEFSADLTAAYGAPGADNINLYRQIEQSILLS